MKNIYVIYDEEAQTTIEPLLTSANDVVPVRQFTELANDPKTFIHQHSRAFRLVQIGYYDPEKLDGSFCEPRTVTTAVDVIHKEQ